MLLWTSNINKHERLNIIKVVIIVGVIRHI